MDKSVKAVVCDFDGTFSTLRCGWEAVMKRMMLKYLPDEAWIDAFIGETTGVQTILQMKGFLEEVRRRVETPRPTGGLALRLLLAVVVVATGKRAHLLARDLDHGRGDGAHELDVVRDEQDRALVLPEHVLQERAPVEV